MSNNLWYYLRNGERVGPFRPSEIRRLTSAGMIAPTTVLIDPQERRIPAGNVKGLFSPPELVEPPGGHPPAASVSTATNTTQVIEPPLPEIMRTVGAVHDPVEMRPDLKNGSPLRIRTATFRQDTLDLGMFKAWWITPGLVFLLVQTWREKHKLVIPALLALLAIFLIRWIYKAVWNFEARSIFQLTAALNPSIEKLVEQSEGFLRLEATFEPGWRVIGSGELSTATVENELVIFGISGLTIEDGATCTATPTHDPSCGENHVLTWEIPLAFAADAARALKSPDSLYVGFNVSGCLRLNVTKDDQSVPHRLRYFFSA